MVPDILLVVCFIDSIWREFHKKQGQIPLGNVAYDMFFLEISSAY